ncbi:MAG: hypothetical protein KDB27_33895 [Planctomycetales bacterium]|nr:hypothetical protein [Planctomycetales bacterium]
MQRIKLMLSYDHELSLGGAESYDLNLFEPTQQLLELAKELQVPLVLFSDIWSAIRFRDWDPDRFYNPYRAQLQQATADGHDVQLHIHPHWVDSTYDGETFQPSKRYKLADFRNDPPPTDLRGIIRRGFEEMTEICRSVKEDYRCIAYRGGGYNLEPEAETILSTLLELGIVLDSTIVKGMQYHSPVNSVDYRGMPTQANWFIAPESPLSQPAKAGMYEVPIAAMPRTVMNNIPFLIRRVLHKERRYKSTGFTIGSKASTKTNRFARLFPDSAWTVSFDGHARTAKDVLKTLRYHVNQHRSDSIVVCAACSHPKFMGPYQREVMKTFVESARKEYGDRLEFVTARQIYDDLDLARNSHAADSLRADVS